MRTQQGHLKERRLLSLGSLRKIHKEVNLCRSLSIKEGLGMVRAIEFWVEMQKNFY